VRQACVLDSYAILALLGREPASEEVAALLHQAVEGELRLLMSRMNLGEMAHIFDLRVPPS
jgi:PIN domain nuclease of toxin-antitoxin system